MLPVKTPSVPSEALLNRLGLICRLWGSILYQLAVFPFEPPAFKAGIDGRCAAPTPPPRVLAMRHQNARCAAVPDHLHQRRPIDMVRQHETAVNCTTTAR